MEYWLPVILAPREPVHELATVARVAEEVGFAGLALIDHVVVPVERAHVHPSGEPRISEDMGFLDPFTLAAFLAGVTTRLKFLSFSYVLPARDPFSVAKQVGTAAMLSGYRVILGAGVGWLDEEMALMGHDPRTRGRRADEMLEIIRDFWDDGYAERSGTFYDVPRSGMFPRPEQRIPVYVGGMSDAALRRAARHDGWMADSYAFDELAGRLGRLAAFLAEEGRAGDDFAVVIGGAASHADEYEAMGVTGLVTLPWVPGAPEVATAGGKARALVHFAERHIVT